VGPSPRGYVRACDQDDVTRLYAGINPLNAELNPICHLLALLGGATIVVVSRLRVKQPNTTNTVTLFFYFYVHNVPFYCLLFICTNKYIYVLKYQTTLQTLLHVSLLLHRLQGALILHLLKL
jgi:hypothetical protein